MELRVSLLILSDKERLGIVYPASAGRVQTFELFLPINVLLDAKATTCITRPLLKFPMYNL